MLYLDDSLLIGKGANRICYQHPLEQEKCVKIPHASSYKTQILECDYYKLLHSNNISWKHICRYHGEVDTNIGRGFVYELICDFDNTISLPFSDYLQLTPSRDIETEVILQSLKELKQYLLLNKIIIRNLRPYNILFKRASPTSGIAIIIDNLGHHNGLFHISDRIAYFARKDIKSKWQKFESILWSQAKF
jgi:hypothetical protein